MPILRACGVITGEHLDADGDRVRSSERDKPNAIASQADAVGWMPVLARLSLKQGDLARRDYGPDSSGRMT